VPLAVLSRPRMRSGLFALNREISVSVRLRGGAERTRTACQVRSHRAALGEPANKKKADTTPAVIQLNTGKMVGGDPRRLCPSCC